MAQASTPSRPVRSARTRVQSYNEDTESHSSSDEQSPQRSQSHRRAVSRDTAAADRPRRSTRAPRSYRELSTDDDLYRVLSHVLTNGNGTQQRAGALPRRPPPQSPQTTNSSPSKKRNPAKESPRKRRKVELQMLEDPTPVDSGTIPPWHTLPYHILFNIFLRASYPLIDLINAASLPSAKWLVDVALLCRSFAEPALAALYHTPVLIPSSKVHRIVDLLSQPPEKLAINYASKIQELLVDVQRVLSYKPGPSLEYVDLSKLIEKVPHVRTIRLYHRHDGFAPLIVSHGQPRWTYQQFIFDTLKRCHVRLHSFEWNGRFMDSHPLAMMMQVRHREASFQTLRSLRLCQIMSDDSLAETEQEVEQLTEMVLARALKELTELRHLSLVDSTVVNEVLLPRLPTNLQSLTIDNCDEITSQSFTPFLADHGAHLQELVLKHNRHLDLSFISHLAESCPKLERLVIDLNMHSWPPYYNGIPHFENLIKPNEIPTWPKALQDIELVQLRHWDKARAVVFFQSLVNAAQDLKDLRRIVIAATVPMSWQDRASFRKRWLRNIEHTFLRREDPPKPDSDETEPAASQATPTKRHSARIARKRLSRIDDDSETGPTASESDGVAVNDDLKDLYVQGMCDVVALRIDNLRPSDTQFNENDFIDSEVSGDEEWNGEESEPEDDYAW